MHVKFIPVIKMFNFELFTISINQILLINDLSFPTVISLSEKCVLMLSVFCMFIGKNLLILSHILHVYL